MKLHRSLAISRTISVIIVIIIIVLAAIVGVVYYYTSQKTTSSTVPIKIGMITVLSGTYASLGKDQLEGVELAVKQINDSGGVLGRPLQLFVQDEGSSFSSSQIVGAANILIEQDHVNFIICCTFSGDAAVVEPVLNSQQVLDICSLCSADYILNTAPGNQYLYTTGFTDQAFSAQIFSWLHAINASTFAFIGEEQSFVSETGGYLKNDSASQNVSMVLQTYFPGSTTDFTSIVNQIAVAKPDAVVDYAVGTEDLNLQREFYSNPLTANIPILHVASLLDTPSYADSLESSAPGVLNHVFLGEMNDMTNESASYLSMFDATFHTPGILVSDAFTYDAMQFLARAIEKAGTTNTASVIAALSTTDYYGVTGYIVMQGHSAEYGQGYRTGTIYEVSVVNGSLETSVIWPRQAANATVVLP